MRTDIFFAGILIVLSSLMGCTKKEDNIVPPEVVAWIKPIRLGNEAITVQNLTRKADDGFLASGLISYSDKSANPGLVINMDSNGDTIWCRKIQIEEYPNNVVLFSIQKSESEIIIAGLCSYLTFKRQRFIAWLDAEGNQTKYLLFPVENNHEIDDCKIIPLGNGNFYYAVNGKNDQSAYILNIDLFSDDGSLIRSQTFPGIQTRLESLYLEDNENLLLVGSVEREFPDYADFLFLLIDASGNEIYRRSFGTSSYDVGYSACGDHHGGHVMSGLVSNLSKPAIYPVNSSGVVGNRRGIEEPASGSAAIITEAGDGGYNLIIQTVSRLYFLRMGADLTETQSAFLETPPGSNISYVLREVLQSADESVAFLYDRYGPVIIKTIPLNQIQATRPVIGNR
jgi:hypothetical protein